MSQKILGVMVVVACGSCAVTGVDAPCSEQLYHTELLRCMACVLPAGHGGAHAARCPNPPWCNGGRRVSELTVSGLMDALNGEALTRAVVRASGPEKA